MHLNELPIDIINCLFAFIDPIDAKSIGSTCRYLRKLYCDLDNRSIKINVNRYIDLKQFISCGKRFIKIHFSDNTCVHYKMLHFSQHVYLKIYLINYNLINPFKLNMMYICDDDIISTKFAYRKIVNIEVFDDSCFHHQIRAIK